MRMEVERRTRWHFTIVENDILETDKLNIYQKMVYISLCKFANKNTGESFPSITTLSEMSGASVRKVSSVLKELKELRLLDIEVRLNNTSIYTLLEIPDSFSGAGHAGLPMHTVQEVMHTVQEGGARGADELYSLNKNHINNKDIVEKVLDDTPYKEVIDYLNLKARKSYRHTTASTKKVIKARFNEGATLEEFKRVIDTKSSQWLSDPKYSAYLRPETLFGTKFEGYLNEEPIIIKNVMDKILKKTISDAFGDMNAGE